MWIHFYSFIVYIKTDDIYKDIAEDVETRFNALSYKLDRPFPKGKNKEVIGYMKDELGKKVKTKFVGPRAKTYSYLIDILFLMIWLPICIVIKHLIQK